MQALERAKKEKDDELIAAAKERIATAKEAISNAKKDINVLRARIEEATSGGGASGSSGSAEAS
jgi:chromosome segregation ATPase